MIRRVSTSLFSRTDATSNVIVGTYSALAVVEDAAAAGAPPACPTANGAPSVTQPAATTRAPTPDLIFRWPHTVNTWTSPSGKCTPEYSPARNSHQIQGITYLIPISNSCHPERTGAPALGVPSERSWLAAVRRQVFVAGVMSRRTCGCVFSASTKKHCHPERKGPQTYLSLGVVSIGAPGDRSSSLG